MTLDPRELCRVCGLWQEEMPWGSSGDEPSNETCACCGTQFGYEDFTRHGIASARERWRIRGYDWHWPKHKPANWSAERQLEQIGIESDSSDEERSY